MTIDPLMRDAISEEHAYLIDYCVQSSCLSNCTLLFHSLDGSMGCMFRFRTLFVYSRYHSPIERFFDAPCNTPYIF